jgi:NAD(P)-dependent dehydrogenase (short-subunit alcohol dehydrogenase family)
LGSGGSGVGPGVGVGGCGSGGAGVGGVVGGDGVGCGFPAIGTVSLFPGSPRRMLRPVGDLDSKTFLITGANTGIGRATAQALAARGARVFIAGRSEAKTRPVINEIASQTGNDRLEFLALDLGNLDSVQACAEAFLARGEPLHVLINNAGMAGQRGTTDSGFELAFGTNYVGPYLLTSLLLPCLKASSPSRVVNVASEAHYRVDGIDFEAVRKPTKTRTGFHEYSVSKLANVLHAQELARRLDGDGVTTYSLHPGVIASDIWRSVPWPIRPLMKLRMSSTEDGSRTSLYCATSPDVAQDSGDYYEDAQRKEPGPAATPQLAGELWERTTDWLGPRR